ncbi:MAG: hypothetical protein HYV09_20250 [Deltaproteobacteria bacterium]|nr:hypothetical protein [Deltaproteobacteria bacterium]
MLGKPGMSVFALGHDALDLSQHVHLIEAVVAYAIRWGRPPRVVLGVSNDDLRVDLGDELRARGFDVVEAAHAQTLHGALLRSMATPELHAVDLFVVDAALDGCSPLHAMGYARQHGVTAPTILLSEENEHAPDEAARLDLERCARSRAIESIDRVLLRVLRRRWSERPVAA